MAMSMVMMTMQQAVAVHTDVFSVNQWQLHDGFIELGVRLCPQVLMPVL